MIMHFMGERPWAPCVRCNESGVVWLRRLVAGCFIETPSACGECRGEGRIYDDEEDER